MLNDIYNKRIIELAGNIPRLGRLPDPHASATAHSCGFRSRFIPAGPGASLLVNRHVLSLGTPQRFEEGAHRANGRRDACDCFCAVE
jgi:hypothetical protein